MEYVVRSVNYKKIQNSFRTVGMIDIIDKITHNLHFLNIIPYFGKFLLQIMYLYKSNKLLVEGSKITLIFQAEVNASPLRQKGNALPAA